MAWITFNVDMMKKGLADLNGCILSARFVSLGWYLPPQRKLLFVKCHLKNRAENVIKALSFYFGQINELHGVFYLI